MPFYPSFRMFSYFLTAALCATVTVAPLTGQAEGDRTAAASKISPQVPAKYKHWLDQDVRWIISHQERAAFLRLTNDEDRDRFIEAFWTARDPTPDTPENEFKEEHYRRIVYAKMHFGWGKTPGWETDRGRVYIVYGPPEKIDRWPFLTINNTIPPKETWHYKSIERRGRTIDLDVDFTDVCRCGDFRRDTSDFDIPQ